jgi:deoxyribodipyrimidine photolyase-related protein
MHTVVILGDQLNRGIASLEGQSPGTCRILMVRSETLVRSRPWHRQRAHLILTAMRRFAGELRAEGFEVDERHASTFAEALAGHRADFGTPDLVAMEPMNRNGSRVLADSGVRFVRSNQWLCHPSDFSEWASGRPGRLRMEDFYRWQRTRLGVLLEADGSPSGGVWNLDRENREPPPRDGRPWPEVRRFELDELDREVLASLPPGLPGAEPAGWWPTSREQALVRLDEFIESGLSVFGPHEDAMLGTSGDDEDGFRWKLAHSVLSSSLNLGLLHPAEAVEAAEAAYRQGRAPLASAEGFIRQVMGWREYVSGIYWHLGPDYASMNALGAERPLPPVFTDGDTAMACVADVLAKVERLGWAHHIERLMVLGNLALLTGVSPRELNDWMRERFVDGAEWVMLPNVLGMVLHADGGIMATKPYAAGGAYINRMSDHCSGCRFDPKRRTGEDACPFTTLYWDFLDRHRERLDGNHRMRNQFAGLKRLSDLPAVRTRAAEVLELLDAGSL